MPEFGFNHIHARRHTMIRRRILTFAFLAFLLPATVHAQNTSESTWRFAVSGDSRNCGDVVMPAIAKSVLEHKVEFYWHLGDFRLGYGIDDDMKNSGNPPTNIADYQKKAWDDFISQQIAPFGSLPVHLGIGNHELYFHGTTDADDELSHAEFIKKFSQWLGGSKTAYYHWKVRQVDFISMDNSRNDGFEAEQLSWLETLLKEDAADSNVRAVVVGMHRALPNSLACGHSMNGDPYNSAQDNRKSTESGRAAYRQLWRFQNTTGKGVYVLASIVSQWVSKANTARSLLISASLTTGMPAPILLRNPATNSSVVTSVALQKLLVSPCPLLLEVAARPFQDRLETESQNARPMLGNSRQHRVVQPYTKREE